MSFGTAALLALGGIGRGLQTRRDNALAQEQEADTHAYNQAEIEQQRAQTQDARRLNSLDPITGQPIQYKPLPNEQVTPGNRGKPLDDATYTKMHIALLYRKAQAARAQGDYRDADAWESQARDEALNAGTLANAQYTTQGKLPQALSQVQLNNARAKAVASAQQTAIQIAGIRNAGMLAVAQTNALSRQTIAKLSNSTRVSIANLDAQSRQAVAQLAGAYRIKGYDEEGAWRAALGTFQAQMKAYSTDEIIDPNAQAPAYSAPSTSTVNVNVGYPQIGPNGQVTTSRGPSPIPADNAWSHLPNPKTNPSGSNNSALPNPNPAADKNLQYARTVYAQSGHNRNALWQQLETAVQQGVLTQQRATDIFVRVINGR